MAFLKSEKYALARFSRWGDWEREILSRLADPGEAQKVITERQVASDVESEESDLIEELFEKKLQDANYRTKEERIFIPVAVASKWFAEATGERLTVGKTSRAIRQKIDEGQFKRIVECPHRHYGRGFEWWGEEATPDLKLRIDLEHQIEISGRNHFE